MQDRPMAHDALGAGRMLGGSERLGGAAVGAADRMHGCGGGAAVGAAGRMFGCGDGAGARASAAVGPADRMLDCGAGALAVRGLAEAKPPAGLGLTMFDLSSRS